MTRRLDGHVTHQGGAGLPDVTVRLEREGAAHETTTDTDGRFTITVEVSGEWILSASREGFVTERLTLDLVAHETRAVVILQPALREEVTVVASRRPTRLADTPSSVVTLDRDDLGTSGAARVDDILRSIPGFSLFRRSGSRTANPTAQGVSLRGVGATGASRSLVLDDGVPLNDPFGGWIYWGRVPTVALERVEVLRGGASDLYGSSALGGVIGLVRRDTQPTFLSADTWFGSAGSGQVAVAAGGRRRRWGGIVAGEWFRTDGYVSVAEGERGAVDVAAGTRHAAIDVTADVRVGTRDRLFVRGAWFDEARENGTPLQVNDTRLTQVSAGWDAMRRQQMLGVRAYASRQSYDQSFSAVSLPRDTESLTRVQQVPAEAAGGSAQWGASLGARTTVTIGGDHRVVWGRSEEHVFTPGGAFRTSAGGRQHNTGVFAQGSLALGRAVLIGAGLRYDRWQNDAGEVTGGPAEGGRVRSASAVSPRLTLIAAVTSRLSVIAAAYRAFRAPTLNELYRGFRVGNTITEANPTLGAERLTGAESGLLVTSLNGRVAARGTLFWMEVSDPIANVTVSQAPALITRRRENLGRVRSRGIEVSIDTRAGRGWVLSGGYLLSDSTVVSQPADGRLEGLRVPLVPQHAASIQGRFTGAALGTVAIQARVEGHAFEDDRNTLVLGRYAVIDALWSRTIGRGPASVFVAGENVTDTRYDTGRTPVRMVGAPRSVRAGIRLTK